MRRARARRPDRGRPSSLTAPDSEEQRGRPPAVRKARGDGANRIVRGLVTLAVARSAPPRAANRAACRGKAGWGCSWPGRPQPHGRRGPPLVCLPRKEPKQRRLPRTARPNWPFRLGQPTSSALRAPPIRGRLAPSTAELLWHCATLLFSLLWGRVGVGVVGVARPESPVVFRDPPTSCTRILIRPNNPPLAAAPPSPPKGEVGCSTRFVVRGNR